MKKSPKMSSRQSPSPSLDDKTWILRFQPIHDMVADILARVDPSAQADMLKSFYEEYRPVGDDVLVVERLAEVAAHMRGCHYLDTEIMKRNMEECEAEGCTVGEAVARTYGRKSGGARLLAKLDRYQDYLRNEVFRCVEFLRASARTRREATEKAARFRAEQLESFAKLKPATPVIQ